MPGPFLPVDIAKAAKKAAGEAARNVVQPIADFDVPNPFQRAGGALTSFGNASREMIGAAGEGFAQATGLDTISPSPTIRPRNDPSALRQLEGVGVSADRMSGSSPIRGALLHPSNPFEGASDAFIAPSTAQLRNMGGIRSLSDENVIGGLSPRDIAGGVGDALADPFTVAGAVKVAPKVGRGVKAGALAYRDLTENIPIGMSVKDVGDSGDEAANAAQKFSAWSNAEGKIRKSGKADAEIRSGRGRQAGGVDEAIFNAAREGKPGLGAAAEAGTVGHLRTTLGEISPLSPAEWDSIDADLTRKIASREGAGSFDALVLNRALRKGKALQEWQMGGRAGPTPMGLEPNERRLLSEYGYGDFAESVQDAVGRSVRSGRGKPYRVPKSGPPSPPTRFGSAQTPPGSARVPSRSAAARFSGAHDVEAVRRAEEITRQQSELEAALKRQRSKYPNPQFDDIAPTGKPPSRDALAAAARRRPGELADEAERRAAEALAKQRARYPKPDFDGDITPTGKAPSLGGISGDARARSAKAEAGSADNMLGQALRKAPKARDFINQWADDNRRLLDGVTGDPESVANTIRAKVEGSFSDPFLTQATIRRNILRDHLMRGALPDPDDARAVSDLLFERELRLRYPKGVPDEVRATLKKGEPVPFEDSMQAIDIFKQRSQNTQFGLLDFAIGGQQGLNALRRNPAQIIAGGINRTFMALNLPHVNVLSDLDRQAQFALDGLAGRTVRSGMTQQYDEVGSLLSYGGRAGRAIDKKIAPLVEKVTDIQFGTVLGNIRDLDHEGNLVLLKLLGRDIADPVVRRQSAQMANHATSAAQRALTKSRSKWEQRLLISPMMLRARVENLTDAAKLITPQASLEQRMLAATTIIGTVGTTLLMGEALQQAIGAPGTQQQFDPSMPGFGTVTTKFKNAKGESIIIDYIPQDAVDRAFAKALRAISESDETALGKALATPLISSASVVGRPVLELGGVGYQPGEGYRFGDLEGDWKKRAARLAPIPPAAQAVAMDGAGPIQAAVGIGGVGTYPESPSQAGRRGVGVDVPTKSGLEAVPAQSWRALQAKAPEEYRAVVAKYGNISEFRDALEENWTAKYLPWAQREFPRLTPEQQKARARLEAETQADKHPVVKYYSELKDFYETKWFQANPEEGRKFLEEEMRKPESERRMMPTQKQRELIGVQ